mmetsp:Transcript_24483/g.67639  ORF Transcript_24483/g.67639 Transcript_24483/m.67639 type:complete len:488 (-) Transcript_24483:1357-2820(-)|eukprot:CAMPEP_0172359782 /NCGR_PEP_ID=MMETSP1060-20121228/3927_1 /TAXON_ID=37318 /ORGANISM="Pseudo-nitzschia pungens, Strain cf. cingulata" /LENGTH=487 /DNA_ID=CAMNT_0013081569 /DNA_START=668 /DNA_END=2131 /DNA_ORIENTATION=+
MNHHQTKATAAAAFRETKQSEDGHNGAMWLYSSVKGGYLDNATNTIPLLSTFSCDSVDEGDMSGLGVTRKNCFAVDKEEQWPMTDAGMEQSAKRRKTTSKAMFQLPIVVTPERAERSEICLDPLPIGYELPLGSLIMSDQNFGTRSEASAVEKDNAKALLFPLIGDFKPFDATFGTPEIRPSTSHCRRKKCLAGNHKKNPTSSEMMDGNEISKIPRDLLCSEVYKLLRPSLPLPESLRAVLCLLLHMEYWSSSTIITSCERVVLLKSACSTVNDKLLGRKEDATPSHGSKTNANTGTIKIGKKSQDNISGKVIDALVERLGSSVDLAILFQASAETNNDLAAAKDNRLDIFFHDTVNDDTSDKQVQQHQLRVTTTGDANTQFFAIPISAVYNGYTGHYSKTCTKVCESHDECECRSDFTPTMLQLAVAFGVHHYRMSTDHDLSSSNSRSMTLEDFVKRVSDDLDFLDENKKKYYWNTLVKVWDGKFR